MANLIVDSEDFNPIFEDIKSRYLSRNNFPKLIIGSGLSVSMGIPGMHKLADKLAEVFLNEEDHSLKETWKLYEDTIKSEGLEAALLKVSHEEELFIQKIKEETSLYILKEEYSKHDVIDNIDSGFEKLIEYLSLTVSNNDPLIDIMTPNYDRVIELICDKLKLPLTLGFSGNLYQTFNSQALKSPHSYYAKEALVRLFKPHGSINWVKKNDREYQIQDYNYLEKNYRAIDIITPGNFKFKYGMTNNVFRLHREYFNDLLNDTDKNYSIFIYGYGFNDQHFDTVIEDTDKDVLVLTKNINVRILERALCNSNWTLFYEETTSSQAYMIYKKQKFMIDKNLWNIDEFANTFLGLGE